MKRRFYKKVSIFVCIALLFCCLPFSVVKASSLQDDSKPIFGLTANDVVDKYNQLNDQQKDQVLRSLGNTSIFANSLFGNIFNSTFGVLDDAIEKIGDLFFQANGVIYKLGSSALAWVSRLIDKVFNNDLSDLNISQPVIDDLYLNTRNLNYLSTPFFINGNIPAALQSNFVNSFVNAGNIPTDCEYIFIYNQNSYYSQVGVGFTSSSYLINPNDYKVRLIVDLDSSRILVSNIGFSTLSNGNLVPSSYTVPRFYSDYLGYWYYDSVGYRSDYRNYFQSGSIYNWGYSSNGIWNYYICPVISCNSSNYLTQLQSYLKQYFYHADSYVLIQGGLAQILPIGHTSDSIDVTNNTYYNYIYNIPDQTPLNVTNIVSNTAINYDPVENLIQYLPDNYNIEQNFSVVNNYYISSGSAITTQGAIDVNLVSPSVIDVRITNPEDISNQVHNEVNKNIINNNNINFGDLNISVSVDDAVSQSSDILNDNIDTSEDSPLGFMVAGIPPDLLTIFGAFVVACLVCALFERVFR